MMADSKSPEQIIGALLEGKSTFELKTVLARLEYGGASVYHSLAKSERNQKAREALLAAAKREEDNAKLLVLMTTAKGKCEKCESSLPAGSAAYCCSFQCTFCPACASGYQNVCPNCGGELEKRQH
jgi:uncharacterized protein